MKIIYICLFLILAITTSKSQAFEQQIALSHTFQDAEHPVIVILNISGNISAQEHDQKNLSGMVLYSIESQSKESIHKGKEEIHLEKEVRGDTVFYFLKTPCNPALKYSSKQRWGYDWSENCDQNVSYLYQFDFDIKVPKGADLILSTINNGDIYVKGSGGIVDAQNINGSIHLDLLRGKATYASTINGEVLVKYDQNPTDSCRYYTLNGNIHTHFKNQLSAQVKFESFNGHFYSDADVIETLPNTFKVTNSNEKGINYRINKGTIMQLGASPSTVNLEFETFNGDAFVHTKN